MDVERQGGSEGSGAAMNSEVYVDAAYCDECGSEITGIRNHATDKWVGLPGHLPVETIKALAPGHITDAGDPATCEGRAVLTQGVAP